MNKTFEIKSYTAFGFNISSEFALPELTELDYINCKDIEIDLIIKKGDLSYLWLEYAESESYYYIEENLCMVRVPDVAIYKIENGDTITVSPFEGSKDDQNRLYILGTCMGVALMQRKILPIHGSCISVDGKAYAIVGDSGAGKSTLASAFIRRGFKLLTDDVIAVTLKDNIPTVLPSYPQQKLWQESLDQFGIDSSQLKPILDRKTKFAIPVKESFIDKPMPLAGIYTLNKIEKNKIDIFPIQQLERFPILYYNTYRYFMINRLGLLEWHFGFSAKMVNRLDFYRVNRPKSRFTAEELMKHILSLINESVYPQIIEKEQSL